MKKKEKHNLKAESEICIISDIDEGIIAKY